MRNLQRNSALFLLLCLFGWLGTASAQVSVAIAPPLHPKFTDNSGNVLAGGFLYSYSAGTTTLLPTYADSGGIVQNTDPISLDSTGAPSSGSSQTGIWLGNLSYKFCAFNSSLVQQWCTDNVTGYFGLLNLPNTWTFAQTFTQPITDTQTDNQIVLGAVGNQTTLDFPPPAGNVTLHFPITTDTMVGRATTDTLTNKTLTSPVINNPTFTGTVSLVQILYKNVVAVTHTGDTNEDTIFTTTLPALSANSIVRVTISWKPTVQGAAGTNVRAYLGAAAISQLGNYNNASGFTNNGLQTIITIANQNATNSQIVDTANNYPQVIASGPVTNLFGAADAVATNVPVILKVTSQNGSNTDSQTFFYILVELL